MINLTPGQAFHFTKTVTESDVYLFAGITGDFSPNHVDAEYGRSTRYGERIAHGVLVLSFASTTSSKVQEAANQACVSLGYDRVRFLGGVLLGDTITVTYTVDRVDNEAQRSYSNIEVHNQRGELVLVATHILKFFLDGPPPGEIRTPSA